MAESTQASSLSESTDETLHPSGEPKESDSVADSEDMSQEELEPLDGEQGAAPEEALAQPQMFLAEQVPEEVKDLRDDAGQSAAESPSTAEEPSEADTKPPSGRDVKYESQAAAVTPVLPVSKFSTTSSRLDKIPGGGFRGT